MCWNYYYNRKEITRKSPAVPNHVVRRLNQGEPHFRHAIWFHGTRVYVILFAYLRKWRHSLIRLPQRPTEVWRLYVHVSFTGLHPNQKINAESKDRKSFTSFGYEVQFFTIPKTQENPINVLGHLPYWISSEYDEKCRKYRHNFTYGLKRVTNFTVIIFFFPTKLRVK